MGTLNHRLERLERKAFGAPVVVKHEDGTVSRFRGEEVFPDAFMHEYKRGKRRYFGEEPGEAHPFVVALRTATNLDPLIAEHGTVVGLMLGEDEIIRGVRERTGASVRETSPGLYE